MDTHIVNLLKTNNRVILPEFGAFIVKSGTPRTIVFNEFLKYNDEVLLKEISRVENISESEAAKKLEEFTQELNSQLDMGQHHKVGTLGMLSKDNNGRVHFRMFKDEETPQEETSKAEPEPQKTRKEPEKEVEKEEIISLSEEKKVIEAPEEKENVKSELKKEEPKKEEVKKVFQPKESPLKKDEPKEKIIPPPSKLEEKKTLTLNEKIKAKTENNKVRQSHVQPKKSYEQPKENDNKIITYLNNNRNVVWYGLVGIIVIAIAIWFIFNREYLFDSPDSSKMAQSDEVVIQPETESADNKVAESEVTESNVDDNTPSDNTEEIIEASQRTSEATGGANVAATNETSSEISRNQTSGKRYYIVAGCFQQEKNADNYVNYLNGQGYNSEKFGKYGGLFAVSFNSFASYSEAQKEMNKIKESTEPQAWILYY